MALYLVQHGKSLSKEEDPERGLSPEGISDVNRIASVAGSYGIKPTAIRHSGKKRARQTAEIYGQALLPEGKTEQTTGLDPLDDVSIFAGQLRANDNIMLVGHLPFMERLTNFLVTGSVEKLVFRFQNGGIVCLDRDPDSPWWFIKWTLMPKIE